MITSDSPKAKKTKVMVAEEHEDEEKYDHGSSDDDDEREVNQSQLSEYYKMIGESDGFDVDIEKIRDLFAFGLIIPIEDLSEDFMKIRLPQLVSHALKKQKEEKGEELELVRIMKANAQSAAGYWYYITFEAKDVNEANPKVYQLCIWDGIDEDDVEIETFRLKPSSPAASSSSSSSSS